MKKTSATAARAARLLPQAQDFGTSLLAAYAKLYRFLYVRNAMVRSRVSCFDNLGEKAPAHCDKIRGSQVTVEAKRKQNEVRTGCGKLDAFRTVTLPNGKAPDKLVAAFQLGEFGHVGGHISASKNSPLKTGFSLQPKVP
jgi:hypothetical protein